MTVRVAMVMAAAVVFFLLLLLSLLLFVRQIGSHVRGHHGLEGALALCARRGLKAALSANLSANKNGFRGFRGFRGSGFGRKAVVAKAG